MDKDVVCDPGDWIDLEDRDQWQVYVRISEFLNSQFVCYLLRNYIEIKKNTEIRTMQRISCREQNKSMGGSPGDVSEELVT